MIEPLSHSDIGAFLLQLGILLFVARIFGWLAIRLGQASVVGEIVAGFVLGPSILGVLFPQLGELLQPQTTGQSNLMEGIALLGVLFLLFTTGLEIDLGLIRQNFKAAVKISAVDLLISLSIGLGFGLLIPKEILGGNSSLIAASFVALTFGISAIPVIAKILLELQLTRRTASQILFAVAMMVDAVGWILLSTVIGVGISGEVQIATVTYAILAILICVGVSFTIGRYILRVGIDRLIDNGVEQESLLPLVLGALFFWSAFSQFLQLEAMFGAFILGIIFRANRRIHPDVLEKIEVFTHQFLAPIFFVKAGLKVNAALLLSPTELLITILFLLLAFSSKFLAVYFSANRLCHFDKYSAGFIASGMSARGSIGIIVGTVGLSLNLISTTLYSIIVLVALITSVISPTCLKWFATRLPRDKLEEERLLQERLDKDNVFTTIRRVLVPLRLPDAEDMRLAHQGSLRLLKALNRAGTLQISLVSVAPEHQRDSADRYLKEMLKLGEFKEGITKVIVSNDAESALREEVKKGYDLSVLRTHHKVTKGDSVFSPVVDQFTRFSPCPTVLLHGDFQALPKNGLKVLVPTNGSLAGRRASELAFTLLKDDASAEITFVKVVEMAREFSQGAMLQRQYAYGREIVSELRDFAKSQKIEARGVVELGHSPEEIILELIAGQSYDLLILGTRVRIGSDRLFLGPRVERLLELAPCPVIVLNL